jgi:hypothetical protein
MAFTMEDILGEFEDAAATSGRGEWLQHYSIRTIEDLETRRQKRRARSDLERRVANRKQTIRDNKRRREEREVRRWSPKPAIVACSVRVVTCPLCGVQVEFREGNPRGFHIGVNNSACVYGKYRREVA